MKELHELATVARRNTIGLTEPVERLPIAGASNYPTHRPRSPGAVLA